MNFVALLIGTAIALLVIVRFRATKLEKKQWVYPLLLASFPFYYFTFAVYAGDIGALIKELYVGVIFIAVAYIAYKFQNIFSAIVLALGYIGHAVYDVIHNDLFINNGTPTWWPEFCGAVDGLIGVYLVYLAFALRSDK